MDTTEQVYLTPKQLADKTGISVQTLANDRHLRRGFPYSKRGKSILYFWPDVHTELQSTKIRPDA